MGAALPRLSEYAASAQQVQAGALEFVKGSDLRCGQQPAGEIERAGPHAGLGGGECPVCSPRGVHGERHRPLEKRGRRGEPAARLSPTCGALELQCDILIRGRRRCSKVPRTAIRIGIPVGRLCQRQGAPPGDPKPRRSGTPPSAPADDGRSRAPRAPTNRRSRSRRLRRRSRDARTHSATRADRQSARPRRPRAAAACPQGATRARRT